LGTVPFISASNDCNIISLDSKNINESEEAGGISMAGRKILKAFALGLCLSVLFTGTAFARTGGGSLPSSGKAEADETDPLLEKQAEIDRYVFADHTEEIKKAGFEVIYTGVADTFVEIGIHPYNKENANYLYKIFGKDIVKVAESEEAALDTVTTEKDNANTSDTFPADTASSNKGMENEPDASDTPVASSEEPEREGNGQATADQKLEIQVESLPAEEGDALKAADSAVKEEEEFEGQSATAEDGKEAEVISAPDKSSDLAVVANFSEEAEGISGPVTILLIAGGSVILGGVVLLVKKKKGH
jgi:hypothetical protein